MAALGLTTYNQFALATTEYGTGTNEGLLQMDWTPGEPQIITHLVASSVTHPEKYMGRGPAKVQGVMQLQATNLVTFLTALQTQTQRKCSWVWHDGTEVYVYVYAGTPSVERYTTNFGAAAGTKLVRVSFIFQCGDQRLYQASDDSILLGG